MLGRRPPRSGAEGGVDSGQQDGSPGSAGVRPPSPALHAKLEELERQRAGMGVAEPAVARVTLHAGAGKVYAKRMSELAKALETGDDIGGVELARGLVDKVLVYPPERDGEPHPVEMVGDLAQMLELAGLGGRAADSSKDPVLALFISSVKEAPGAQPRPPEAFFPSLNAHYLYKTPVLPAH